MGNVLGLDLGTNSIGWALRSISYDSKNENQISKSGILTFEKGVASKKGLEHPKVKKRTEKRGLRRNYQAEKYRKWGLLEFLIEKNMCPLSKEELDEWKKYVKGQKKNYPQSKEFVNWLRFDFDGDGKPDFHLFDKNKHESYYLFRTLAIDENYKKIFQNNPLILGRILYQLVQRRGFRGRDEEEEEAKEILTGSDKTGTAGRNAIAKYIEKYKTLGAALYHYQKDNGGRIRQRYNLRKDYEAELKEICDTHNINESDYNKIHRAIIWQRPLRSQKGMVGTCIYEQNKRRVSISHPLYEEYRIWVFINNLKIEMPFGIDKDTYLREKIYPIFLKTKDFELNYILKQLAKDGGRINSKFNDRTKIPAARTLKYFQDILGKDWKEQYKWNDINKRDDQPAKKLSNQYYYEDIWHVLKTFDSVENLKKFAIEKLNLDEDKAEKFSKITLNQGYATLSLSAIKKILPYLQKGFLYSHAIYLANLHKVLGQDQISEECINQISDEINNLIEANREEKIICNIINSLIQDELQSEYPYQIENDREIDNEETLKIEAKINDHFGQKTWNDLPDDKKLKFKNYIESQFKIFLTNPILSRKGTFLKQPRLQDEIFKYLQKKYDVSENQKKYLWHPSEQENYKAVTEYKHYSVGNKDFYIEETTKISFLKKYPNAVYRGQSLKLLGSPEPESKGLKNPMALKTLHKLRQLLNYQLQKGEIDEDTRIVIEIARELNDANRRKALEKWNKDRNEENEKFIKKLNEGLKDVMFSLDDKTLIRKYRLWQEQGGRCLYTGKTINLSDLLNGNNYDIEHTIPASISFDSELKNLTLADAEYNRNMKRNHFPTQMENYYKPIIKNGIEYPAIIKNIEVIFGKREITTKNIKGKDIEIVSWKKISDLQREYDDLKNKARHAKKKDVKDLCIQEYHLKKMELDYLHAKLKTFTIDEYKGSWRNSQLRDTQIITKYVLPYLKTLFKKVEVQKPQIVNAFKEIYNIKNPEEKKNRYFHYHHAIDAATMTLIPSFFERDKILEKYYEAKNYGKIYHTKPQNWANFSAKYILDIEKRVLINNLCENKTLLPAIKKVRKRGKIEYIKSQNESGEWQFKLDQNGNKIPKIATGDSIRGQLFGDSFYGAIKETLKDENGKILLDENGKAKLSDENYLVIRKELIYEKNKELPGFHELKDIEKVIVDKGLFAMIKKQVEEHDSFESALANGIYMLDKKKNKVNKIRHVRCKVTMKYETAMKVHEHSFSSDKEYKRYTMAKNGENALCLYYQNGQKRAMRILSINQVAKLKFKNDLKYFEEKYYNNIEVGKGKKIPLHAILRIGCKILFYENNIEELKDFLNGGEFDELSKRLFKITNFEKDGRIKFKYHLVAGSDKELKKLFSDKEYSDFNVGQNQIFLRLTKNNWNFAIENVDFIMHLDGTIEFIDKVAF